MAGDKDLPSVRRHGQAYARLFGFTYDLQAVHRFDILFTHLGMAGMGHVKDIIEPAQQRIMLWLNMV